jgi:hypothetical protein
MRTSWTTTTTTMTSSPERWVRVKRRATKWRQHCSTCGVTFAGPQVWSYCSKRCELSRRGADNNSDLSTDVLVEMSRLFRAREMAARMDKHIYQELLDNIDRSGSRVILRPDKAIDRATPAFWEYIMSKQSEKYSRAFLRLNQELLRTLKRLVEAEQKTEVDMQEMFPETLAHVGLAADEVRAVASSGAIEKYIEKLPASPEFWAMLSDYSDDEIEEMVVTGKVTTTTRMGSL